MSKTPNAVNTREKGKEVGTKGGTLEGGKPNFTPIGATYRPCGAKNL